jgi:hypothetical protein
MNALGKIAMISSPEADIIRRIEWLIRKVASGEATDSDLQVLHDLQQQRVELMRPKVFQKKVSA